MSKFAIQIKETLTRTVVVDADSYKKAEDLTKFLYDNCYIVLDADNSSVEKEFIDDTENYKEIFGENEFNKLEESIEVKLHKPINV